MTSKKGNNCKDEEQSDAAKFIEHVAFEENSNVDESDCINPVAVIEESSDNDDKSDNEYNQDTPNL